jgi:hypothetical protein
MNLVNTIAPISIEDLKKFFTDKSTFYIIKYNESTLKGAKLFTYLSNLDIPCDIDFSGCDDITCYDILKEYLNTSTLVNIPILEKLTIFLLLQEKEIVPKKDIQFLEDNKEIIQKWISKIDSLSVYNMSIVKSDEFKNFVNQFPVDDTDSLEGINFISLLKNPDLYAMYGKVDRSGLKYYSKYFNDYMFKGKNMYSFWATENNPMFMLTYGISEGLIDSTQYNTAKKNTIEDLANVAPIQ